jgi:hypothetical protein
VNRQIILDVLIGSIVILLFEGSSFIDRSYYGIYGLKLFDLQLIGYLTLALLMVAGQRVFGYEAFFIYIARFWMLSSLAFALLIVYGAGWVQVFGLEVIFYAVFFCGVLALTGSLFSGIYVWSRIRLMVLVFSTLIVVTPIIVGPILDEQISWLGDAPAPAQSDTRTATLVLLFDEMNSRDSFGMQKILMDQGLQVQMTAVMPVHGSTTEVIPALFSKKSFEGARPCGFTRVCAKSAAFDFAKLSVDRKDVDVVGFHHPYCSIEGLRYCRRLKTNRFFFDWNRWECGFIQRVALPSFDERRRCQKILHSAWLRMREEVIESVFNAPSLQNGGVLFAHLPFPHPPAIDTGSLSDQYVRNLRDAEGFLKKLLTLLAANKIEPRILIFSDHPLRQALWCAREPHQFDEPCVVDPVLLDEYVPLIVAGQSALPPIKHLDSNRQVFDVLTNWLRE